MQVPIKCWQQIDRWNQQKVSVDAGMSRWMMLRRHCQGVHSRSIAAATGKARNSDENYRNSPKKIGDLTETSSNDWYESIMYDSGGRTETEIKCNLNHIECKLLDVYTRRRPSVSTPWRTLWIIGTCKRFPNFWECCPFSKFCWYRTMQYLLQFWPYLFVYYLFYTSLGKFYFGRFLYFDFLYV